jgi:para-aminobenzoate synthetase component I
VLRRVLASHRYVVVLRGAWRAGPTLIAVRPRRFLPAGADPFAVPVPDTDPAAGVCGGWFGLLRYDLGERRHRAPIGCAAGDLAYFDRVVRQDPTGCWWLAGPDRLSRTEIVRYRELIAGAMPDPSPYRVGPVAFRSRAEHLAAVRACQRLIAAGEIFQANICLRLYGRFTGDPAAAYLAMDAALSPARGAFVRLGGTTLASMSPELYLDRDGATVTSAPIKGTLPRRLPVAALRRSTKDRAENVMIVDLVRNDLGRVAVPDSVSVPRLLDVEPAPGVWHLVSRVSARLPSTVDTGTVLRETFPPGSVTGCPKLAALDAIDALEASSRGGYTGAIGYLSGRTQAEWNVAIRTFEFAAGRVELGVGGGITIDSDPAAEWAECWHKAAPLLAALRRASR